MMWLFILAFLHCTEHLLVSPSCFHSTSRSVDMCLFSPPMRFYSLLPHSHSPPPSPMTQWHTTPDNTRLTHMQYLYRSKKQKQIITLKPVNCFYFFHFVREVFFFLLVNDSASANHLRCNPGSWRLIGRRGSLPPPRPTSFVCNNNRRATPHNILTHGTLTENLWKHIWMSCNIPWNVFFFLTNIKTPARWHHVTFVLVVLFWPLLPELQS